MSEAMLPVFGPAVARLPENNFSLVFPIKDTTVQRFDLDALETAAKVCLYDMVPDGTEVDDSVPVMITWGQQFNGEVFGGTMHIIHMIAKLKDRVHA